MKSSYYLKHDLDARQDGRIRALLMKLGARGYGIYWMIAEDLYREGGRIVRDYAALAWAYHEQAEDIKAVAEDFDLFFDDAGKIACHRVDHYLSDREEAVKEGHAAILRRKRPDGSPWLLNRDPTRSDIGTLRVPLYQERRGKESYITAAKRPPSAADLSSLADQKSVKTALTPTDNELLLMQLPFSFGDIPKGRRVIDIDVISAQALLDQAPRLGLKLRRALAARLKIKSDEKIGGGS